jgi:hypothetical protein
MLDEYETAFLRALGTLEVSNLVVKDFEFLFAALKRDLVRKPEPEPVELSVADLSAALPPPAPTYEAMADQAQAEQDVLAENLVAAEEPSVVRGPPPPLDEVEPSPAASPSAPPSPAKLISAEYVQQVLQTSLATQLVRDSIQQALDAQRGAEMEALQSTIKDLQSQLKEAVEAKKKAEMALKGPEGGQLDFGMASLAETSFSEELNSTRYQLGAGEAHPVSPGGVTEDGFVVDFEIDPQTMEVRVDIVGNAAANKSPTSVNLDLDVQVGEDGQQLQ